MVQPTQYKHHPPDDSEHLYKIYLEDSEEKIAMLPDPAYKEYGTKLALRSFFNKVTNARRPPSKVKDWEIKFTLFLEPVPYLCLYQEGDEELTEFQPVFYDSFRLARYTFVKLLDLWYVKHRAQRKASNLP